ncbi:MAG: hypothetical protein LAT68_03970 [Cyclobacteriaceae bacterium]|nr:hypothetical protein [Cyclobacteriaceae bacterium]MCH8515465.1 hypothetical protein [Cyclobacteriaceae bacterium]
MKKIKHLFFAMLFSIMSIGIISTLSTTDVKAQEVIECEFVAAELPSEQNGGTITIWYDCGDFVLELILR